ncbi:MAG: HEAT repeat domain-containing protein [candidate division KSB1 bacterium]|nr:HEAT repeat domain-containing protein [candidate division KSB1 bacterium]
MSQSIDYSHIKHQIEALTNEQEDKRKKAFFQLQQAGFPAIKLLQEYLHDNNVQLRLAIVELLSSFRSKEALQLLVVLLKDRNKLIQNKAALAIGESGFTEGIEPLLELLGKDEGEVSSNAIEGLIKFGTAAIPYLNLISVLNDKNWKRRSNAALALGKLGVPEVIEPFLSALKDEEARVRCSVIKALGKLRATEAINPLYECLEDEDHTVGQGAKGH